MKAPVRAPAPAAPTTTPAPSTAPPAPATASRKTPAGGPPVLRLVEPRSVSVAPQPAAMQPVATQPVATPVAAPVTAPPERRPEPQREESFTDVIFWGIVRTVAPDLEPIMRRGIFGWLEDQITAAIGRLVDTLFAPIRAITGVAATLTTVFQSLLVWMQEAAAKIAKGDCSSIAEAAEKIEQVVSGVLSAVTDKVKALAARVGDFFTGLWNRFGAPIWDMLKAIGGRAWERIQALAGLIWDSTATLRRDAADAWQWIKDRLGVGEGPEGKDGLLQWVQAKAEAAWNWIKPRIEPYKKQLLVIAGIIVALSPAGPLLLMGAAAGGAVVGVMYGIRWIRDNLRSREAIIAQRGLLAGVIIPTLMRGMQTLTGALKAAAGRLSTKLGDVVGALGQLAGSLAASILDFATRLIEWVGEQFQALSAWVSEKLDLLVDWVTEGLERLKVFLQPVLDVLRTVADIYLDLLKLPLLAAAKAWNKIPACLRDPFVSFLINQVLKRIPLFKQVTEVLPAIWQKVKTTALSLLRKVFREGKFKEAALDVLVLVLDALQVPLELVQTVLKKGMASIDLILDKPVEFLTNMLAALREGVAQFRDRIVDHLLSGLKGWLFGAAEKAGLHPPQELTFRAVFDFILEVLGITTDKVLDRLEERIGKEKMIPIRKALTVAAKVWEWLSTLFNEGPQGVWTKLKEKLGDLWQGVIEAGVGYITKTVTKIAIPKVLAMVAGGPIGVVINGIIAIWKALQAFAKYFKKILEIMNGVFDTIADIARGAIAGAANMIEKLMDRSLPVIIGFLANQIGLGDISERIAELLETIQAKVTQAIDWLIDKALAIGGAVLGLVKAGIAKVLEWWKAAKKFIQGGKEHTLKFQGEGADAKLTVESTPIVLEDYLRTLKPQTPAEKKALAIVEAQIKIIEDIKTDTKGSFGQAAGKKIQDAFDIIVKQLPLIDAGKIPRSEIDWPTKAYPIAGDEVGQEMLASPLSLDPGGKAGSQPFDESLLWQGVNLRPMTYVQGHLLNHHVHGPGAKENLVPITRSANTKMETTFEHYVKQAVLSDRKVIEYHVVVKFKPPTPKRTHIKEENLLPSEIVFEGWEMKMVGTAWQADKTKPIFPTKPYVISNELGMDTAAGLTQATVNLSEDTPKLLERNPNIPEDMAQAIRRARLKRSTPFHFYKDLEDAGLTGPEIAVLENDKYVTLR